MVIMIMIFAFLTVFVIAYLILTTYVSVAGPIEMRLKALQNMTAQRTDIDETLAKPFRQRILAPLTGSLATGFARFAPMAIRRATEEKIAMAGGFGSMSTDQFLLMAGFLAISLPLITIFCTMAAALPLNKVVGWAMIAFVVGCILPGLLLNQRIAARKLSMQKDLPDALDLLTVSVEAGLGFDGALAKLTEKMKGELVEEFNRVLQEIRMGVTRREALVTMGLRCDVADLSLFTSSLVQADQLGVSIGNVLRIQSAGMREKRKQRAEEKAMKAPIKMMLPLVLFIFPTIFIVLLGPAVIQVMTNFLKP